MSALPDSPISLAAERRWPVIVVGAGVAGASAAFVLARAGVDVLLVDRGHPPRAKTCGGCLNARALAALRRMGLGEAFDALCGNRLEGMTLCQGSRRAEVAFPAHGEDSPTAVSREALDAMLVEEACRAGATFLADTRVTSSTLSGEERVVEVRGESGTGCLQAGMVIAADGLGSVLARGAEVGGLPSPGSPSLLGASTLLPWDSFDLPLHRITMAVAKGVYVGLARVEDGRWNVAAAIESGLVGDGGPRVAITRCLASCGISFPRAAAEAWVTCPRLHRTSSSRWAERLLLVGDAAGYAEPITGEGMACALAGAEAASRLAIRGWNNKTGPEYEGVWQRGVLDRQRSVRVAGWLLRSEFRTAAALSLLGYLPGVGCAVARRLNDIEVGGVGS